MPTNISGTTGIDKVQDGTIVDADIDTVAASKLTGALPAISGANLTNVPAANITGTLPAISGANLTSVNAVNTGRKNMVIGGGMNVWQRGTSATISDGSNEGYNTVDRFKMQFGGAAGGEVTWNQSTDVPANQGFGSSLKVDCTGTFTPDAAKEVRIQHAIEGQNIQSLAYGDASPKTATLSFWFKTNKIGIYSVYLEHSGTGTRRSRYSFTPASSGVWEKITINVTGDSVAIPNTSSGYFSMSIYLANVPSYCNSTATIAWGTSVNLTNSSQVNFMDSTSNELYLTGVQLEVGSTATDFEHRSYGEELALCQRYYEPFGNGWTGYGESTSSMVFFGRFKVTKRAAPTVGVLTTNMRAYEWGVSDRDASTVSVGTNSMCKDGGHIKCSGFSSLSTGTIYGLAYNTSGTDGEPFSADSEL